MIKNFANFATWQDGIMVDYGHMEELTRRAEIMLRTPHDIKLEITFVEFDGDIDDENTKVKKGQVILSYTKTGEHVYITSGK